ncbi:MAG: c-type cytochrome [Bacteroidetes bacterium]|nr:MAG: c-type cytochrome [Bacteroidota bacterium]
MTRFYQILSIQGFVLLLLVNCQQPEPKEIVEKGQFSRHIRTTSAKSPQEEKLALKVPPGFKIELFASEPDIGKPMNMSFDAKGRMWVTQSNEYPFFDSIGIGPDRISILEDTDHDGRADKFTVFADSLNIPIGIVPVADGAIAYSIPYVYHLVDTDGDDQVDERKILLKGFEYKDTHGMINNLFRGLDGWIHADHGFANNSQVVGTDNANPVIMKSGNTFRFRPDGSGVEFTTTGRVNPFGYAMDEFGYLYSVDCHSSPIYQLIRGADYPHFGKQPTGIGFGPSMMRHGYGSTALAGLEYYTGNQYPKEYQQNFYLGDVVKSRVYRSSVEMIGTTPVLTWQSDFIVSEDPWFRPVDVKLGPDGAIYIADFYNRIIGHYEVPLNHPGRDRERGRIWRISYEPNQMQHRSKNWTLVDLPALLEGLNDPSLTVRMMVADQIVDRFSSEATTPVRSMLRGQNVTTDQVIHGMWIIFRLDEIDNDLISKGLQHSDERIRVHTLRIMFELENVSEEQLELVRILVRDCGPHIKRAGTMLLAKYPSKDQLHMLLDFKSYTDIKDTHLYYTTRQCLRDHLRNNQVMKYVTNTTWDESDSKTLADVMVGVNNLHAADFLLSHLEKFQESVSTLTLYTTHTAKYLPPSDLNKLLAILKLITEDDLDLQYQAFQSMQKGVTQSGGKVPDEGVKWAIGLASEFLNDTQIPDTIQTTDGTLNQLAERQIFACEVVGTYKVNRLVPQLINLLSSKSAEVLARQQAARALLALSTEYLELIEPIVSDPGNGEPLRDKLLTTLVEQRTPEAYQIVRNNLSGLSLNTKKNIVRLMASDPNGIDEILAAAITFDISPKILVEPSVHKLLEANMSSDQQLAFEKITADIQPFSEEIQMLINKRVKGYDPDTASVTKGAQIFLQNCSPCHQIRNEGGNIGPQLDGIGNWGLQALTEKTMDPNRNISKAFINYSIKLNDGGVRQGLFRRDEGEIKVFADNTGQEFSIPTAEIKSQEAVSFTLMPDNFSQVISEEDYYHLMSYLLGQN